jgi:hypothetical protein
MIHVDSVDRASHDCPTRRALAPRWRLMEATNLLPPNDAYDPQPILASLSRGLQNHPTEGRGGDLR